MELHSKYCIIYTCILLLMIKRKYKVEYPIMTKICNKISHYTIILIAI